MKIKQKKEDRTGTSKKEQVTRKIGELITVTEL
jgi:hypothetical protein